MAKLTNKEVEHIAELARLKLTDKEKALFGEQLSSILEYVAKIAALDTSRVDATAHVFDTKNVTRDDEVKCPPHSREILLSDFPARKDDLCQVPPVFETNG